MKFLASAKRQGLDVARVGRDRLHSGVTNLRLAGFGILRAFGLRRQQSRQRLLFVDEMLPDPRLGAGFPRAAEMIEAIVAAGWQVVHFAKDATDAHREEMRRRFGGDVQFLTGRGKRGLVRILRERGDSFDAILISRPTTMGTFLDALKSKRWNKALPYIIFDAESIFADRQIAHASLKGNVITDQDHNFSIKAEVTLTSIADAILTVSESDADVYRKNSRATVHVVNHAVRAAPGLATFDDRSDIVIIGKMVGTRDESPNVDSIFWYLDKIAPLLRENYGICVPLTVVGNASPQVRNLLSNEPVIFTGVIDDLTEVYDRARVLVAPTRYSAGLPLKVIEAAAAGVPCAVTRRIAKQVGYLDDVHARIGDDAATFAHACADLYQSKKRWQRIRENALQDSARRFSVEQLHASVAGVLFEATEFNCLKENTCFSLSKQIDSADISTILTTPNWKSDNIKARYASHELQYIL